MKLMGCKTLTQCKNPSKNIIYFAAKTYFPLEKQNCYQELCTVSGSCRTCVVNDINADCSIQMIWPIVSTSLCLCHMILVAVLLVTGHTGVSVSYCEPRSFF